MIPCIILWRRKLRRQCIAELKSQMKPFNFVKRDEDRRRLKLCRSTPELRDICSPPKSFKARPVPRNLFSSYVYQRMREDEFYRSLKKKIRAEELLKSSSLPPSMAAREEISKTHSMSAELLEDNSSDRPKKRRHKIPNYKKSHDLMRRELEARWNENITTSPQPFHLKTEHRGRKPCKKHKIKNHQKYVSSRRCSDGNISRQNSPDLYSNRDDANHCIGYEDKTSKLGLKVSINETAETIECSSDEEHKVDNKLSQVRVEKHSPGNNTRDQDDDGDNDGDGGDDDDDDEYSASIQEDITAEKSSEEDNDNKPADNDDKNDYGNED